MEGSRAVVERTLALVWGGEGRGGEGNLKDGFGGHGWLVYRAVKMAEDV